MKVLRWHSRVPLVAPERVDDGDDRGAEADRRDGVACRPCQSSERIHRRRPRRRSRRIADAGIPLVSQSVLLKGVNDDAETLAALMRAFVENRVKPYYLHHGDLAPGTVASPHRTSPMAARLMRAASRKRLRPLPADLRARYPRRPRQGSGRAVLRRRGESQASWSVEDPQGSLHAYPPAARRLRLAFAHAVFFNLCGWS